MKVSLLRYPDFKENPIRSASKSVIWRLAGILILGLITYVFTKHWITTTAITLSHHAVFILVYYLHERFWNRTSWLRYSAAKPFVRMILYETVLGFLILGTISFAFTGDFLRATAITVTYIINKHWIYYVYDWLWARLKWQTRRRKTVYAYVAGDLLHIGHLRALQQAKDLGDYLIVGVITDEGISAYKRRPIIPFEERIELVANFKCVDEVVKQESVDPTKNLKRIKPDILVHGDDWHENFPGAKYMRSIEKKAVLTKYYQGQSTTKIIKKILLSMKEQPAAKVNDGQS